ncbi:hypothetical protein Tco_0904711 [Tanacetum coccineum]
MSIIDFQKAFLNLNNIEFLLNLQCNSIKKFSQKNNTFVNQTEPSFDQLFELNNLKDELQAKDTTIEKLKANIKRLNKTSTTNNVKKDIDEIGTINIELEHKVVQIVLWYLESGCSKHMTGDRSQLTNFVHKFLGTVKFDSDQIFKDYGGFAAVLAVLINGASQSKQHGKSESDSYYLSD